MTDTTYAVIEIHLSRAGLHCICEELEEEVFCQGNDLDPLVDLINEAESICNPDATFTLTEKGRQELERMKKEGVI